MKSYTLALLIALSMAVVGGAAASASAATFTVDTITDDAAATACVEATPNDCSLRGAILAANERPFTEVSTITVPAGTYVLSQSSSCTYKRVDFGGILTTSQIPLCLARNVIIQGAGAATTIIDGAERGRVVFISADATVEIRGVTITNGLGDRSFFENPSGGGIDNHGTLTLTETVVSHNRTAPGCACSGGGIISNGTLSLVRSTVSDNVAGQSGGGIYNAFPGPSVTVVDSTISNNIVTAGFGGGFGMDAGSVTITNSTLSGNTVTGLGGGIALFAASPSAPPLLTVTNSTISGNESGSAGGGIAQGNFTNIRLRNVTITNNTSGAGGGGVFGGGVTLALRNTVIAGNRDTFVSAHPDDCRGTLTSEGHNLLQNVAGCIIAGDTTGDIYGQAPLLDSLADNGGLTRTHALGDGSPALDAGNPAAPGSGGDACVALDQRGGLRPQGGRCDIGAYEAFRGPSLAILPNRGGNTGSVLAIVYGPDVPADSTVKLARAGQPDIVGNPVTLAVPSVLGTSFDLGGKATGAWDMVLSRPGQTPATLAGGFTIEEGRAPQLWVSILNRAVVRVGRPTLFTIAFGNRGNVDANAVALTVTVPASIAVRPAFQVVPPPAQPGQVPTDWSQVPVAAQIDGLTYISLLLPVVPAGFTGTLEFFVTAPLASRGIPFDTEVEIRPTFFDAPGIDQLVELARVRASRSLGVDIPPARVPQLVQYVTAQLQRTIDRGLDAAVAGAGTNLEVYGLQQLLLDAAQFGATLVAGSTAPGRAHLASTALDAAGVGVGQPRQSPGTSSILHRFVAFLRWVGSLGETIVAWLFQPDAAYAATDSQCQEAGYLRANSKGVCTYCASGDTGGSCTGDKKPTTPGAAPDPNEKTGATGAGTPRYIAATDTLAYAIFFENLETGELPAQEVIITDQLDGARLDLGTLSLGPITFGTTVVSPTPGLRQYGTSVDLRPARNLIVTIDARLDESTGVLTWRLASVDPATLQLPDDPFAGFLPPNVNPPEGEGSVLFTVKLKPGLPTGTEIRNKASIVFDVNDPIETPTWLNTVDSSKPASRVTAAGPPGPEGLAVQWSGSDVGAGIRDFTIFVSENGGPAAAWLSNTSDTSGTFVGTCGAAYAFYSVARDLAGNVEDPPATPDATVALGVCDLAITRITAPANVDITRRGSLTKPVTVHIQNRSPHPETIPDAAALAKLVTLTVDSLGGCAVPSMVLRPQAIARHPITLKARRTLNVVFDVTFDCANDPIDSTQKNPGHHDFRVSARLDHSALGSADAHPDDDLCPRSVAPPGVIDPYPDRTILDKGCGARKLDGTFGGPIVIDVIRKP